MGLPALANWLERKQLSDQLNEVIAAKKKGEEDLKEQQARQNLIQKVENAQRRKSEEGSLMEKIFGKGPRREEIQYHTVSEPEQKEGAPTQDDMRTGGSAPEWGHEQF